MNDTLQCPQCMARLEMPRLPPGQAVQCPRCRHVFASAPPVVTTKPALPDLDEGAPDVPIPLTRPRPLRGESLAKATIVLLALCVVSYCVQLYFEYENVQLLKEFDAGPLAVLHGEKFRVNMDDELRQRLRTWREWSPYSTMFHNLTFWPTMFVFLFWLHRAADNAWRMHAVGMYFVPATAVVSYFVPLINLFWPYLAMQEIYRASHPQALQPTTAWKQSSGSPLIIFWWLCCLGAVCLWIFRWLMGPDDGFNEDQRVLAIFACLSNVCMLTASLLLILIIRGIMDRQRERYAQLDEES